MQIEQPVQPTKYSYLPIIAGLFVAALLITNVANTKMISVGPFVMTGGTLLFPLAFIFNDILTEVYGYAKARSIIWTGIACQMFAAAFYWVVGELPSASFWAHQESYEAIFSIAPRIAVASMFAYLCGEFANSMVLSRMKYSASGARGVRQSYRFIVSSIVGEGLDSVVFIFLAFGGTMPLGALAYTVGSIYILKVLYEIVLTPVSTRIANWLKSNEGTDVIDDPAKTRYNPLAFGN